MGTSAAIVRIGLVWTEERTRVFHRRRRQDGQMATAKRIFLDRKFLDRSAVADVRVDERRKVSGLGRIMGVETPRPGTSTESRRRLSILLLVGARLRFDASGDFAG